jgi:SAM-dependent methyltransferase/GT2 family glycosyltransferase
LLCDDCSTDRTVEIAKESWASDVPLVVATSRVNRGEARNMDEAVARLPPTVDWFFVLHGDDFANPGWLNSLCSAAVTDSAVGSVCSSWDTLLGDGSIVKGENAPPGTVVRVEGNASSVADTLKQGCWWHLSGAFIRVKTYCEVGGRSSRLPLRGDWDLLMRMLSAGWAIHYLPQSLMTYRMNDMGVSSHSFRRHNDVREALAVVRVHQQVLPLAGLLSYHTGLVRLLSRRIVASLLRRHWRRGFAAGPVVLQTIQSITKCLKDRWQGHRRFDWASSVDPVGEPRLQHLCARMERFYSDPGTRSAYQKMLDSQETLQPGTEEALVRAILADCPKTVAEIGCGSGRIYERLCSGGFSGRFTGFEMAPEVIASNRIRFPEADWRVGSGYDLAGHVRNADCVFAYYVLEHCVYPERLLRSLIDTVRRGGSVFLVFPDMVRCGILGSQFLGWDFRTAREHLRYGRLQHTAIRLWDSRVRLPYALRRARRRFGAFPVNLSPACLLPETPLTPDVDAVYIASRDEVLTWARREGYDVTEPGGQGVSPGNVLIKITKRPAPWANEQCRPEIATDPAVSFQAS